MSEQLDQIGITDELTKKRQGSGSIQPERDFQDKSVPHSKLQMKNSVPYTDLDPESPIPWSYISMQGGWIGITDTWAYASADSPTFTITVPSGATTLYSPGMRVRLTQSTTKYFLITAVADTTLTVYGGTDYTLTSAAISDVSFSYFKAPIGFPLDPTKWTVQDTDTTRRSTGTPTGGTWYNAFNIVFPIGVWNVSYQCTLWGNRTASTSTDWINVTLSTANNSDSDHDFMATEYWEGASGGLNMITTVNRTKTLSLTSKTTYYLNYMATASIANVGLTNDQAAMFIRAVSAYL